MNRHRLRGLVLGIGIVGAGVAAAGFTLGSTTEAHACEPGRQVLHIELESLTVDGAAQADRSAYEPFDVTVEGYGGWVSLLARVGEELRYSGQYDAH